MFLSTRLSQHGQHAEEAVVCCDEPACASRECHQRLQAIPACIVERCGVLSSLLETAGCAALPFEAPQVLLWLNFRKQRLACSPEPELTPHDLLAASQVLSYKTHALLKRVFIEFCAVMLLSDGCCAACAFCCCVARAVPEQSHSDPDIESSFRKVSGCVSSRRRCMGCV